MKKKLMSILMACAMMIGILSGCGENNAVTPADSSADSASAADSNSSAKVIQLGHVNPGSDEDNLQHACLAFADKLSELSNGTIEVKVVSDSQLGSDREMIEGMQMGTVDMVLCMNSSLGAFVPEMQVFDLPYLFTNRDQVYAVFDDDSIMAPLKDKLYNDAGIKMLDVLDNGFRNCLNNLHPINSVDDVKGMKLRLAENAIWSDCFKAFGASPTAMAFSEVYTACQQGTVDGFELPVASTYSGAYWEVCKYYSLTGHLFTALNLCMSGMTWDGFSAEEQEWIQAAADYAKDENRSYIQGAEENWLEEIGKHMEVNDCADKDSFVEKAQAVYPAYADAIGQDLLDTVMAKVTSVG